MQDIIDTKSNNVTTNNGVSYNVSDLLTKISSLIDTCDYQLAFQFAKRALSMEQDNVQVLEILGMVEIELGMFDEAREHFSKAISINPDQGYSKYMYMGQLSESLDAISCFQKGVDLMISEYTSTATKIDEGSDKHQLARKISSALCSMTEIYLTDCCKALEIDPLNPEVYQLLASVRLSQQRNDDAKINLEKSLNLWINLDPGHSSIPSYESRISLVKLLIELSQYTQALNILELLQKEDDEILELWYLYGWCYFLMGQDSQNEQDHLTHFDDAHENMR
ncbi:11385_t:CDS:2 [Funneliformis caledonium]|uniref:11385_t:CDS:1 n=1 Tax=Funneliformis caledonium TaxID=1117310 RepID=A0A9N8VYS6_9GLOM|nr:11385_t:CDS:2 [Funneliformis caledonium]